MSPSQSMRAVSDVEWDERTLCQASIGSLQRKATVNFPQAQLEGMFSYNLEVFVVSVIISDEEYGHSQSLRYVHTHGLSQVVD